YVGRQWHQLWLMTSEGGDILPLTYGEFDATAPRWSRDARHIAYISNEGGNTALWVIDVPGAHRRQIVASERRYRDPVGRLRLVVVDAAGRPLPARVSVTGVDGRAYAPDDAWRQADEAFDRQDGTNRGFEYGYFHTTGTAELTVPTGAGAGAGAVQVEVWHGPDYRVARADLTVPAGRTLTKRLGAHRVARPLRPLPAARVRWLSQHRGREPVPDERRRGGPRARARGVVRVRPPVRHAAGPERHDGATHLRAAGGRGARQGRLPGSHGILGSPHHVRDLVPTAQLRLPDPGRGGHRCFSELRVAAGAAGV